MRAAKAKTPALPKKLPPKKKVGGFFDSDSD